MVFLLTTLTSALMTGLIWFVQIVHYPLFREVGESAFVRYENRHTIRTGWVVVPIMIPELVFTFWLGVDPPAHINPAFVWVLIGLTVIIWLSTGLIQVPLHTRLNREWNPKHHRNLVNSNWIRTICWTLKTGICFWILSGL